MTTTITNKISKLNAKRNKHKKIANIEYYIQYLLSFIF